MHKGFMISKHLFTVYAYGFLLAIHHHAILDLDLD